VLFDACEAVSYSNHLPLWLVQAIQALPGVNEIMALDKELFILEPVQCVPDSSRRQRSFRNDIFLRELSARFQHFVYELCRWRQVPDLFSGIIPVCVYDKNDPS
jgi:hypothetical protein